MQARAATELAAAGKRRGNTMTDEKRAIELHDLALSVVRSKGVTRLEGSTTVLEYRYGLLTIQCRSGIGRLHGEGEGARGHSAAGSGNV